MSSLYTYVIGQCDESCLELGLDSVHKQKIFNFYKRLVRSRSHMRITSLRRRGRFYQKGR